MFRNVFFSFVVMVGSYAESAKEVPVSSPLRQAETPAIDLSKMSTGKLLDKLEKVIEPVSFTAVEKSTAEQLVHHIQANVQKMSDREKRRYAKLLLAFQEKTRPTIPPVSGKDVVADNFINSNQQEVAALKEGIAALPKAVDSYHNRFTKEAAGANQVITGMQQALLEEHEELEGTKRSLDALRAENTRKIAELEKYHKDEMVKAEQAKNDAVVAESTKWSSGDQAKTSQIAALNKQVAELTASLNAKLTAKERELAELEKERDEAVDIKNKYALICKVAGLDVGPILKELATRPVPTIQLDLNPVTLAILENRKIELPNIRAALPQAEQGKVTVVKVVQPSESPAVAVKTDILQEEKRKD